MKKGYCDPIYVLQRKTCYELWAESLPRFGINVAKIFEFMSVVVIGFIIYYVAMRGNFGERIVAWVLK